VRVTYCLVVIYGALCVPVSAAAVLPFSEEFTAGTAGWRFANAVDLTWVDAGGVDAGPYVSRTFAFSSLSNPAAESVLVFRAHDEYGSSDLRYAGNWASEGVGRVTALVRHSAPDPLTFNVRLSGPANFPGASYASRPVPANQWTQFVFDVTPASVQNLTYEGTDYATVFSSVGHIQFGVDIPAALRGSTTAYSFDLDSVRVSRIPESTAWALAVLAIAGSAAVLRRTTAAA
jgi:hypothetical protein